MRPSQREKKNKDVDKKLEINILPEREKEKKDMIMLLECCILNFWSSVGASVLGAGIVLVLTFWFLKPKFRIGKKAVIIKDGGYFRFQIRNIGLTKIHNIHAYLYTQKDLGAGDAERGVINLNVAFEPVIKNVFSKEYENTVLLDTEAPIRLSDLEGFDLIVQVSAVNSFSNISKVCEQVFTKNDILYGDISHRHLVDYDGEEIVLWEEKLQRLKRIVCYGSSIIIILCSSLYLINILWSNFVENPLYCSICMATIMEFLLLLTLLIYCLSFSRQFSDSDVIEKNRNFEGQVKYEK